MKRYSVVMTTRGPKEYATGWRPVARERFLRYLKILNARVLQEVVDDDLKSSNRGGSVLDRKIQLARARQEIVDRDIKSASRGDSPLRRKLRREKARIARIRKLYANVDLKSWSRGR